MATLKINLKYLPVIAVLAIVFASCSGKKSNVPVPADAALVMHIDGKSLNSKLSWDEVKKSEWFKQAYSMTEKELAKTILNDPEESGVDMKSDVYIFTTPRGRGGYAAIIIGLKDEKKFGEFLMKVERGEKIETVDGMSVVSQDENIMTWKDGRMVYIANNPDINSGSNMLGGSRRTYDFEKDSLLAIAKEIYNMKGKKSLGNNSKFSSLLSEKGDMHFWVNSGSMYGNSLGGILALTKIGSLVEGNIGAGTVSFEDGKIVFKGKNYYNKDLAAIYKKAGNTSFNEDVLKKIPAGDVAAAMAFKFKPETIKDLVTLLGVDGILNMALAETGLTINDIIKATGGEMVLSVSDFTVAEKEVKYEMGDGEPYSYKTTEPDAKFLFATSIGDKPSFDRLSEAIKDMIAKKAGVEAAGEVMNKFPYSVKDNWFVTGNNPTSMNSFGNSKTEHPFISKIKGHPMGGYADIQKFISGSKSSYANDSVATLIADESLKTWQDIIFYGGEFTKDYTEMYGEINFVDKKTNSLKLLNNYLGFIAIKMMEQEKRREAEWEKDEWAPPVEDTVIAAPKTK